MTRSHTGYLLLITLMGGIAYHNSFDVPFQFDDFPTIVENPLVRDGSAGEIWQFFPQRWVVFESFALNYRLGGFDVTGYHLLNFLVHLANGFLVYALVLELLGLFRARGPEDARWPSLAAAAGALLFVCHPLGTQAVTYIWQRCTSLAAMFFFLAMICHLRSMRCPARRGRGLWLAGGIASACLAMLTKQSAFVLPFVIFLMEWLRPRESPRLFRRRTWWIAPWAATVLLIPILTISMGDPAIVHIRDSGELVPYEYFATQMHVLYRYASLIVLPLGLSLEHDVPVAHSLFEFGTFLRFLGILLIVVLAVRIRRTRSAVSFALLFFFLAQATESSFLPLADVMFEHRAYLPMLSASLLAACFVMRASLWVEERRPGWFSVARTRLAMVLLTVPLVVATVLRNEVWSSPLTLWRDAATKAPESFRAWDNLGTSCLDRGLFVEAEHAFTRASAIRSKDFEVWNKLGLARRSIGRMGDAEQAFRRALSLAPHSFPAIKNLASHLALAGRHEEAARLLEDRLAVMPVPGDRAELAPLYRQIRRDAAGKRGERNEEAEPRTSQMQKERSVRP